MGCVNAKNVKEEEMASEASGNEVISAVAEEEPPRCVGAKEEKDMQAETPSPTEVKSHHEAKTPAPTDAVSTDAETAVTEADSIDADPADSEASAKSLPAPEAQATSPALRKAAKVAPKAERKAKGKGKAKGSHVHTAECSQQVPGVDVKAKGKGKAKGSHVHTAECSKQVPGVDVMPSLQYPCSSSDLLLPKEQVLDDQLSDHLPQIFICGATSRRVRVLTWNIMTQCRCARTCNNGFGKYERADEYLKRLQVIAVEVARFFEQDDTGLPMVAMLQECPLKEEDLRALIGNIKQNIPNMGWRSMQTTRSFANVTLWDRSQWRFQETFQGDDLRALITKLAPVPDIVPGVLGQPCTFVNVHVEWKANPEHETYSEHVAHVAKAVRPYLEEHGLVVVAGDFNMNVADTRDTLLQHCKDVVVDQIPDSSQAWLDGKALPNTVDGVIWNLYVEDAATVAGSHVHAAKWSQQGQGYDMGVDAQSYVIEARLPGLQYPCSVSDNYLLLPNEHVLHNQLSDHLPQIFICGATSRRVQVLTWNIMTQCRYARFPNNGFGKNETGDEYLKRLQVIAVEVARFFEQDVIGLPLVATLQECPLQQEDLGALIDGIKQINPNIEWSGKQITRSFANITLWDRSQWRFQETFHGDDLRALITKLAPVPDIVPGALCQPCTFVNVHVEWKANPEHETYSEHVAHVAEAVRPYLEEQGLVVIAGDFNMNVAHTRDTLLQHCEDVVVEHIPQTSQVWTDGKAVLHTVDGVIWSEIGK